MFQFHTQLYVLHCFVPVFVAKACAEFSLPEVGLLHHSKLKKTDWADKYK